MPTYREPIVVYQKRPIYETKTDIDHEKQFREHFAGRSVLSLRKIKKKLFPCDFTIENDSADIVAFVEFKRRFGALGYPDGLILSLEKFTRLLLYIRHTEARVLFVIENAEKIYYAAELTEKTYRIRRGGRTDRGDAADIEPVVMIPRADFKALDVVLTDLTPLFRGNTSNDDRD